MKKEVISIHITESEGAPMQSVDSVEAVADKGLKGDRYFTGGGTFSKKKTPDKQITLIESEAIAAAKLDYQVDLAGGATRRNIVTRGVALNHLVGNKFKIGGATLLGIKLCEPCGYLEKLTIPGVKASLVHRGGLRAAIIGSGMIQAGDRIETTWVDDS